MVSRREQQERLASKQEVRYILPLSFILLESILHAQISDYMDTFTTTETITIRPYDQDSSKKEQEPVELLVLEALRKELASKRAEQSAESAKSSQRKEDSSKSSEAVSFTLYLTSNTETLTIDSITMPRRTHDRIR